MEILRSMMGLSWEHIGLSWEHISCKHGNVLIPAVLHHKVTNASHKIRAIFASVVDQNCKTRHLRKTTASYFSRYSI